MARLARLVVPGYPHHVVQRGNNRQAIFVDDVDRERYLHLLADYAKRYDLPVHAFVLMPNHVHLMATPADTGSLAAVMQGLGRSYVRWFNARHHRTGTLFEGRFRSSVIDTDRYALACSRYIEMNPVRAGLVASPAEFRWSSFRHNAGLQPSPIVKEHATMWALGNTPFDRQLQYRRLFDTPLKSDEITAFRSSVQSGWAVGDQRFVEMVSEAGPRRVQPRKPGRPRLARHTN
jgi:putative transposase